MTTLYSTRMKDAEGAEYLFKVKDIDARRAWIVAELGSGSTCSRSRNSIVRAEVTSDMVQVAASVRRARFLRWARHPAVHSIRFSKKEHQKNHLIM